MVHGIILIFREKEDDLEEKVGKNENYSGNNIIYRMKKNQLYSYSQTFIHLYHKMIVSTKSEYLHRISFSKKRPWLQLK